VIYGTEREARWTVALVAISSAVMLFASAEADAAKFGQRTLKQGMRGKDVRVLQRSLNRLKVRTGVDGHFGRATKKSVRRLERAWSWKADGIVQRPQAKRMKGIIRKRAVRKRGQAQSGSGVFPIPETHNFGGGQSRFGAGRSGHSHQGQDVFAACGARLLSATAGKVKAREYQAGGAGYYLVVDGRDGIDYVYMHMKKASWAVKGTRLYAGQQIGRVGDSGNASGCHLHFEMWSAPGWYTGGSPFDPLPSLYHWDSYS
jgi:murein DD-endopeptidase MepM/ murein hydrolase activator NlpD